LKLETGNSKTETRNPKQTGGGYSVKSMTAFNRQNRLNGLNRL